MLPVRLISKFSRTCATWSKTQNQALQKEKLLSRKFFDDFPKFLPVLLDTTLSKTKIIENASVRNRIKRIAEYNTLEKKPVEAELMLIAYEMLEKNRNESVEFQHQAYVIGSALEMIQSYFIILDDMQDGGKIRCNKPCWHLLPDVGMTAVNDASLLRSFITDVVRQNVPQPLFSQVMHIFDTIYYTLEIGQLIDAQFVKARNYDDFTIENFDAMNKYKSSFYSVKSPILLALALCKKLNNESFAIVDDLGTDLGILIQSHNDLIDYLDVDESVASKSGHDIQNGKCSWPAVAALELCNPEQRKIFNKCYGSWDPKDVQQIRKIYDDLSLAEVYRKEEQTRYDNFLQKVYSLPKDSTPSVDFFLEIFKNFRGYTENVKKYMHE
ncbi:PREDICTED: farnesyl pyrophosphate synthase-like [Papilio xuthus]|uniref:Farnesyl pyrophosphate synthase-like n=1 Tax=Papilio xuthus TaxID=66420 RepID=A0AAJ6Z1M8_PAPXU|nr:PREDICTED: farnesyl pyrophosphate synthase-like [Papilio xuthus]